MTKGSQPESHLFVELQSFWFNYTMHESGARGSQRGAESKGQAQSRQDFTTGWPRGRESGRASATPPGDSALLNRGARAPCASAALRL